MKKILYSVVALLMLYVGALFWVAREPVVEPVSLPADAMSVLDDPRFAVPEGWVWSSLDTGAGAVRWGRTDVENTRGTVLFFPGLSAPLEVYFEAFSRMRAAGFSVIAMDWPSQGGSERGSSHPQKIHATSLDGHVAAATQLIDQVFDGDASTSRFVVGLSMGAQLGTRVVADHPDIFSAAAFITPAYAIYGNRPTSVDRFMLRSMRWVGLGERFMPGRSEWQFDMAAHELRDSDCSHPNPRTRIWQSSMVVNEALKVGGMTNAFLLAFAQSGDLAQSDAVTSRISMPVWMPIATADTYVENSVAERVCDNLENCRIQAFENAKHCLFEESDEFYDPFMSDLIAFLNQYS
ncbi:MAG: alpha/beta hydrolase [Pseudomonadota bacterium]